MNNKVLVAFLGGLAVASGVMYVAMRRPEPPPVAQAAAPPSNSAQPVAAAEPEPRPAVAAVRAEAPRRSQFAAASKPAAPGHSETAPKVAGPIAPTAAPASEPPKPVPAPSQPVETASAAEPPPPAPIAMPRLDPPVPKPNTVTIPAGTSLTVRLAETLSSDKSQAGDTFSATLDQPLVIDGFVIAERGSRAQGRIVEAARAGKVKGRAQIGVELIQITGSDGQRVRVNTAAFQKQAEASTKRDAAKVGIGAALGAAIGAIAGGGKGAGVGAGVGGAAGVGDVLLTRGHDVELPVETRLTFRLSEPVTVTEKLR